jgi:oxygen-dependent protoporphyrinogen oxidase
MREAAHKSAGGPPAQRLVSLRGGLGSLTDALERELRDAIVTGNDVVSLRRTRSEDGSVAWTAGLSDGREFEADAVVCALPAFAAARLLRECEPRLAAQLDRIVYHTAATVTTAYALPDVAHLPRCTGFVVPYTEGRRIMSATFSSQKYPGRAPEGYALLRAYAGGALQPDVPKLDDEALLGAVRAEFRDLLGIEAPPRFSIVRRWQNALPEYAVGHTGLVASIEREVAGMEGFALAGSAYRGVGIADCIRGGEEAARSILDPVPELSGPSFQGVGIPALPGRP